MWKVKVCMKASLMTKLKNTNRKNIVLYGVSLNMCKSVTIGCNDFCIYYMDLSDDVGDDSGIWLHSFEQAAEKHIEAFVVMCQMISHQDIFLKMLNYCNDHNAVIYDEEGRDVGKACQHALKENSCSRDRLLENIKGYECISFDIFDTLLMRKVLLPEDVFDLVERRMQENGFSIQDFAKKRTVAQEELGLTNPTIYEIYERLQKKYGIEEAVVQKCCELELEIERQVLTPKWDMITIYQKCIEMGKRVNLVSDMYIPAEILQPILMQHGVKNYEKIYISCDCKQLKLQGLLERYKQEAGGQSWLHIGDHPIHDGICAELAGIDYCLVENAYKMAKTDVFRECIGQAQTLEEHIIMGLVVSRLMNSPFDSRDEQGRIGVKSDYDYAYCFCAALLSRFVLWIYENVKEERFDDVLFASRDGYLILKMYKRLLQKRQDDAMPYGKYFYTSRKASVMTCINNEAYINLMVNISMGMSPQKVMGEHFALCANNILPFSEEKYGGSIHKYVWDHASAIFARSEEAKLNYYKYMGKIDLKIGGKYAFMDFVSSGTCHISLRKIAPFQLKGMFAGWSGEDDKEKHQIDAMFEGEQNYFMRHFKIMETFMTSDEPSLDYFDSLGIPVFAAQNRTQKELQYVGEMQSACMDFFEDLLQLVDPIEKNIENCLVDHIFEASKGVYVCDHESVLNHLWLMDDWIKKRNKIEELV